MAEVKLPAAFGFSDTGPNRFTGSASGVGTDPWIGNSAAGVYINSPSAKVTRLGIANVDIATVSVDGLQVAGIIAYAAGAQAGVVNGGTFDLTIPTRRPVRLELMHSTNPKVFRIYYVGSDGSTTAATTSLLDTTGGLLVAAGQTATTVRITNNTGGTVTINWSLVVSSLPIP